MNLRKRAEFLQQSRTQITGLPALDPKPDTAFRVFFDGQNDITVSVAQDKASAIEIKINIPRALSVQDTGPARFTYGELL
jgi:hypothetical protein